MSHQKDLVQHHQSKCWLSLPNHYSALCDKCDRCDKSHQYHPNMNKYHQINYHIQNIINYDTCVEHKIINFV